MSDVLWMNEYEKIGEDYATGQIDLEEFRHRMKRLGFEPPEIDGHQAELDQDRENL